MNHYKYILTSLISVLLIWPGHLLAEKNGISANHHLVSVFAEDDYTSVVYEITIINDTLESFNSVVLIPRSIDTISNPINYALEIGNLPISGMSKSYWSFTTYTPASSISQDPILVFDLQAKNSNQDKLNFPIFSEADGGSQ